MCRNNGVCNTYLCRPWTAIQLNANARTRTGEGALAFWLLFSNAKKHKCQSVEATITKSAWMNSLKYRQPMERKKTIRLSVVQSWEHGQQYVPFGFLMRSWYANKSKSNAILSFLKYLNYSMLFCIECQLSRRRKCLPHPLSVRGTFSYYKSVRIIKRFTQHTSTRRGIKTNRKWEFI